MNTKNNNENGKRIPCEICQWVGTHIPNNEDESEIDLIGFMEDETWDDNNGREPRWMCQNCYDAIQLTNPSATPITFRFAP